MVSGVLIRRLLRVIWWILATAWLGALPWVVWELHTHHASTYVMVRRNSYSLATFVCNEAPCNLIEGQKASMICGRSRHEFIGVFNRGPWSLGGSSSAD